MTGFPALRDPWSPQLITEIDDLLVVLGAGITFSVYGNYYRGYGGNREQPEEKPYWEVAFVFMGDYRLFDGPIFEACCSYVNDPCNGVIK